MSTQEQLEEIKKRCEEILELGGLRTQGAWFIDKESPLKTPINAKDGHVAMVNYTPNMRRYRQDADAQFIAISAGALEAAAESTLIAISTLDWMHGAEKHYMAESIVRAWRDRV